MWIRDSEISAPILIPVTIKCHLLMTQQPYVLLLVLFKRNSKASMESVAQSLFTSEMRKSFCFYSSSINSLLTGWASCHKEQLPVHGVTSACNLCSHAQWSPPLSAWIDNFCSSIQAAKNNITPQPQCTSDEIQLYLFPWWWITLERQKVLLA